MIKTLKQALQLGDSVHEKKYRDTILEITNLTQNKINPVEFFSENFIAEGMKSLLKGVFERFDNPSKDSLFILTQAMGGGKTHNLIAAGLLAMKPDLRPKILQGVYIPQKQDIAKVVAFTGRDNPPNLFLPASW